MEELVVQKSQPIAPSGGQELVVKSTRPLAQSQAERTGPKITADDLQSRHLPEIRDFNRVMRGSTQDDLSDDEAVDRFLDLNRFFMGGNTVSTARNLATINSMTDEEKVTAGRGFTLFNDMENIFSSENTWAETGEGVKDYAAAVLADPVNLLGFGIGKVIATGGVRTGTAAARKTAMALYQRSLAKGATEEEARALATRAISRSMREAGNREIAAGTATQTSRAAANRLARTGAAATVAFDTVVAIGTDAAYQSGLLQTGAQEDRDWAQTGLAALGVLAVGGAAYTWGAQRGSSGNRNFVEGPTIQPTASTVSSALQSTVVTMGDWGKKVANGKEVRDLDTDFWIKLTLGDDSLGLKGVAQSFAEQGFVWQRRNKDDNIMNWVTDVMKKNVSTPDAIQFLKDFQAATGVKLPALNRKTYNNLIDTYAKKMSDSGRVLNAASQIAKQLGIPANKVTLAQLNSATLAATVAGQKNSLIGKLLSGEKTGQAAVDGIQRFQNNTIRMIVASPSTTTLNVQGWGAASTLNSVVDLTRGALYGGLAGLQMVFGKGDFQASKQMAYANWAANFQKMRNLLDPNTTYEVFRSYTIQRADNVKQLLEVGAGGIDIANQVGKGPLDPTMTKLGFAVEKGVDSVQRGALVQAQDGFTKSQEFLYQLDRRVREKYGKSLQDLFQDPNRRATMATAEYAAIEAQAVGETLRSIFSKSYKGQTKLGQAAGIIEDLRNIPAIGLMVPFGRFFNNTVAFMSDVSGLSIAGKWFGGYSKDRSFFDLAVRAGVGFGLVWAMVDKEVEELEMGLGTFQTIGGATGDIVDVKYEFPYSIFKAAARLMAHTQTGSEPSPQEIADIREAMQGYDDVVENFEKTGTIPPGVFEEVIDVAGGQLFRQIIGSSEGIRSYLEATLAGDKDAKELAVGLITAPVSQVASGWTRFLEPYNNILALSRDTDWSVMDRRQGNELINKSIRYMDHMVDMLVGMENLTGSAPQQAVSAASGEARPDMGKFVGARAGQELSYTERVMNFMGLPAWRLNNRSIMPEGDNRFNKLFNTLIEKKAEELWENPRFQRDPQFRDRIWADITQKARKEVKGIMESSIQKTGDRELAMLLSLSLSPGETGVRQALKELGMEDIELEDLTFGQLSLLEAHIKTRDDFIRLRR